MPTPTGDPMQDIPNLGAPDDTAAPGHYPDVFTPWLNPAGAARLDWGNARAPGSLQGAADWQNILRQQMSAAPRANPYNSGYADQSRAAQQALLAQMQATARGPSISAMQATGAGGQNLLGALRTQGPNSLVSQRAAQIGASLAGDAGQARLAEQMGFQNQQAGLVGGMRQRDQQSANQSAEAAMRMAQLDQAAKQFYAQTGAGLQNATDRYGLNTWKLYERLRRQDEANAKQTSNDVLQGVGTFFKLLMGM